MQVDSEGIHNQNVKECEDVGKQPGPRNAVKMVTCREVCGE